MDYRIKYVNRKQKQQLLKESQQISDIDESSSDVEADSAHGHASCDEAEMKKVIEDLKQIVVNDNSFDLVCNKLRDCRPFRDQIMSDKNTSDDKINLLENFPYFFTDPRLVSGFDIFIHNIRIHLI